MTKGSDKEKVSEVGCSTNSSRCIGSVRALYAVLLFFCLALESLSSTKGSISAARKEKELVRLDSWILQSLVRVCAS